MQMMFFLGEKGLIKSRPAGQELETPRAASVEMELAALGAGSGTCNAGFRAVLPGLTDGGVLARALMCQ